MKHVLSILVFCTLTVQAQEKPKADALLGIWLTGSGNGKVEIYKSDKSYRGKIVWMREPNDPKTGKAKTDVNHPDEQKRSRPLLGLINLWGFTYDKEGTWEGGYIYDPKNGKQYKCIISMDGNDKLNVRGYIGISLIGRTDIWTRSAL
jgi:uncharacterized protein (DUF2147 family)